MAKIDREFDREMHRIFVEGTCAQRPMATMNVRLYMKSGWYIADAKIATTCPKVGDVLDFKTTGRAPNNYEIVGFDDGHVIIAHTDKPGTVPTIAYMPGTLFKNR